MDFFNTQFEMKGLLAKNLKTNRTDLENLVTPMRDCVYDALVRPREDYIESFKERVKQVSIPKELAWIEAYLDTFLSTPPPFTEILTFIP